jgi:hypothetical protein
MGKFNIFLIGPFLGSAFKLADNFGQRRHMAAGVRQPAQLCL